MNSQNDPSSKDRAKAKKLMKELEILAYKPHCLDYREANQIVNDFGRILEFLSNSNLFPIYKPVSLLPRDKNLMLEAIAECFKHSEPGSNDSTTLYLGYIEVKECFIDDDKAMSANKRLITDPMYWKMLEKAS